jgi:digeranylgeranylglycerophospholipid reductase
MSSTYEVVVVGAGPAGSVAARKAAEGGLKTLLIEKRKEIGVPVRCAEAIGADLSRQFIEPNVKWIDATISHFAVHNSLGQYVLMPPTEPTLVVNRKLFDLELAQRAACAGAEVRTGTTVIGVEMQDGTVCGITIESSGKKDIIPARLVVAADGTESQVARWAGMKTVPPLADYYIGIEYLLDGIKNKIDIHTCEYHIDHAQAPGGYLWVFPKGENRANVGLVITADRCNDVRPVTLLDRFVVKKFPNARRVETIAGGIPATGALKSMVTNGMMVVGDAAHQADPMTAGGICLGMLGAAMAMEVGIAAVQQDDVSAKRLHAYDKAWQKRFGKMHTALYKLRHILAHLDQSRLDALVSRAAALPLADMPLSQILLALLKNDPGLLLEARTLITSGLIVK